MFCQRATGEKAKGGENINRFISLMRNLYFDNNITFRNYVSKLTKHFRLESFSTLCYACMRQPLTVQISFIHICASLSVDSLQENCHLCPSLFDIVVISFQFHLAYAQDVPAPNCCFTVWVPADCVPPAPWLFLYILS